MNRKHYYNIIPWLFFIIFLFALLPGCAGKKSVKKDTFFEKWKIRAEKSRGYSPSAKRRVVDISRKKGALAGERLKARPEKALPTRKVTMKMYDVDVDVLIRTLARAANQNIMINEKVKGKADVNIKNAPWDQVFRGILRTNGLSFDWEGDIIRIMTVEDMDQDLKRQAQRRDYKLVEPPIIQIFQIDYADATSLKDSLSVFFTKNDKGEPIGSITVDEHTNSLIIQALRDDIISMIPLIEELDRPTRQVLIEANIVEATRSTSRELGVQWGGLYKTTSGDVTQWITPGANSSGTTGDLDTPLDPTSGNVVNFPVLGLTGMTLGYLAHDAGKSILSVQLSALETEGKVNILSSPSITTLDNQKAIIESGQDIPYETFVDGDSKIEYKEALLKLEVTPHVIGEETLKLNILTTKEEINFQDTLILGGQPIIDKKKAETIVILLDGQTTVIGGLNKEKVDDSESRVPLLSKIPLLGYFFKGSSKENELTDVLIFITPHILKERVLADSQDETMENPAPTKPPLGPETTLQ
ncbi:MAG: type IV pilus secretin PilQ [Desulfobacterales bacterium]